VLRWILMAFCQMELENRYLEKGIGRFNFGLTTSFLYERCGFFIWNKVFQVEDENFCLTKLQVLIRKF